MSSPAWLWSVCRKPKILYIGLIKKLSKKNDPLLKLQYVPPLRNSSCTDYKDCDLARFFVGDNNEVIVDSWKKWASNDLKELTRLSIDDLLNQPKRAKIALLVASAHARIGSASAARDFLAVAQSWGCPKGLIIQVLAFGANINLTRAKIIANENEIESQNKFGYNKIGDFVKHSFIQDLPAQEKRNLRINNIRPEKFIRVDEKANHEELDRLAQLSESVLILSDKISANMEETQKTRRSIERNLRREILNLTRQIEAVLSIQEFFKTGTMVDEMHGWPASPDFLVRLIRTLKTENYDAVVEFGSGTSTIIIAKALEQLSQRDGANFPTHTAFEHLEQYFKKTGALLSDQGLSDNVQLLHSPLIQHTLDSKDYIYYDCDFFFKSIMPDSRLLFVVDGPPGNTNKNARYPAIPLLLRNVKPVHLDILLDDYKREDEREIANMWLSDLRSAGMQANLEELDLEKGACFIRARSA